MLAQVMTCVIQVQYLRRGQRETDQPSWISPVGKEKLNLHLQYLHSCPPA